MDYKGLVGAVVTASLLGSFGYLYSGVETAKSATAEQQVVNKGLQDQQDGIKEEVVALKQEIVELRQKAASKEDIQELKKLTEKLLDLQLKQSRK